EQPALRVDAQQIAGVEPGITTLERVAHDLALGLALVVIAVELRAPVDATEQHTGLARLAAQQESVRAAHEVGAFVVPAREHAAPQQTADRTDGVVAVERGDVAFSRAVELADARDAEALLELLPDVRAQAVADGDAHAVIAIVRP